jgi:hypothetical protein
LQLNSIRCEFLSGNHFPFPDLPANTIYPSHPAIFNFDTLF